MGCEHLCRKDLNNKSDSTLQISTWMLTDFFDIHVKWNIKQENIDSDTEYFKKLQIFI